MLLGWEESSWGNDIAGGGRKKVVFPLLRFRGLPLYLPVWCDKIKAEISGRVGGGIFDHSAKLRSYLCFRSNSELLTYGII